MNEGMNKEKNEQGLREMWEIPKTLTLVLNLRKKKERAWIRENYLKE